MKNRWGEKMENQKLVNFLNQLLSNSFVMFVKLNRYHWFIKGRHFFRLHEHFEELYNITQTEIDEIAERTLMIGGKPLATMSKYLKETTLEEANADNTEMEIISQLISDYEQLANEIRTDGLPLAQEYNDEPTSDLLIGILSRYEKELWMLRAYQDED